MNSQLEETADLGNLLVTFASITTGMLTVGHVLFLQTSVLLSMQSPTGPTYPHIGCLRLLSQRLHVALWHIHRPQSHNMVSPLRPMHLL